MSLWDWFSLNAMLFSALVEISTRRIMRVWVRIEGIFRINRCENRIDECSLYGIQLG